MRSHCPKLPGSWQTARRPLAAMNVGRPKARFTAGHGPSGTLELPLNYGPYLLRSLPGLILDAADNEGCFHFMLAGIEKASGNKTISLFMDKDAQKCTRKRYLKMRTETNGLSQKQIVDRVLSQGGYDEDASATEITDDKDNDISDQVLPKKNFLDKE